MLAPQNDARFIAKGRFPQFLQAPKNDARRIAEGFTHSLEQAKNHFLQSHVMTCCLASKMKINGV